MAKPSTFPTGLSQGETEPHPFHRHASPLALILLGAAFLAALFGVFGGGAPARHTADTADVAVELRAPSRLRNGEFFEWRLTVTPKRTIADLTIAVPASLWLRTTQNTMIPAAGEEDFAAGAYRFSYGERTAGEALHVKIDFQLNPDQRGTNSGDVRVLDGDAVLATVPVSLLVFP